MFIKSISIRNFRGIERADIDTSQLTIILGRNGSGKSTILRALNYFYDLSIRVSELDYFGKDPTQEIEIAVTFTGLSENERNDFSSYMEGDDLRVVKIFNENAPQGLYHGYSLQIPVFMHVRQLARKGDQLAAYRELRNNFTELPVVRSADDALEALESYEQGHRDECEMSAKPGQFLGPRNVGGGSLDNRTKFVFIPAVNTAEEEIGGKSGAIHQLVSAIAEVYKEREDVKEIAADYKEKVARIFDNEAEDNKLKEISSGVNEVLEDYAENSSLRLYWGNPEEPPLKLPEVIREIVEGGFGVDVKRVGHGLQRSLVIAILQYLAQLEFEEGEQGKLIIAFEEPEIYQHPSKCRFLSELLRSIASEDGRAQVLMVTHSPYFVDPSDFESLIYARKTKSQALQGVNSSEFVSLDVNAAMDMLAKSMKVDRENISTESLIAFSKPVFNPIVSESFFAEKVVLVEGDTEVGIFSAAQQILELSWERKGVVVVPCGGKTKMDKPFIVLSGLGIDTYLVFDWDSSDSDDANNQYNRGFQILSGVDENSIVTDAKDQIIEKSLCFAPKIEGYLQKCCGHEFSTIAEMAAEQTGNGSIGSASAMKRAETAKRFIEIAVNEYDKEFPLIWDFVKQVTGKS